MSFPSPSPTTAALVTGSSSGLGVEIARCLARRGHNLILVARRLERLDRLAEELSAEHGIRAETIGADLADPSARAALVDLVTDAELTVDVLVNNAGLGSDGPFHEQDVDRHNLIVSVNVDAVVDLCARFVPPMVERGTGAVMNVGSVLGFQPVPSTVTYAATKAFVLSFTEGLHTELTGTGVHATALCPGPVKTEIWDEAGADALLDLAPSFVVVDADRVAEEGVAGLERNRRVVVPGIANRIGAFNGQYTPRSILLPVADALSKLVRR
ncbi:SDR family NAD(P)-dependent oxidoreductase [Ilumatobacter sp.]|uniref:SDR family NAD(P)-dependent oxidoreductase n=1 Tax=Ilumatobacter sp. TaxID=1967498 RepID=UPI003B52E4D9